MPCENANSGSRLQRSYGRNKCSYIAPAVQGLAVKRLRSTGLAWSFSQGQIRISTGGAWLSLVSSHIPSVRATTWIGLLSYHILIYKGHRHTDALIYLLFLGSLPKLVDPHADRPCHPQSTWSHSTRYSYVKNKDSYITAGAIGLAAKILRHGWSCLGRQRESGMLRALGPLELPGWSFGRPV